MQYELSDVSLGLHIKVDVAWISTPSCSTHDCSVSPQPWGGVGHLYHIKRNDVCLTAPKTSALTIIFLSPKPKKTLSSPHFIEWPSQPPWKSTKRKGSINSRLPVYGTYSRMLVEEILSLHLFMCLLYPTSASVASSTLMGTQQQRRYPLQSDF